MDEQRKAKLVANLHKKAEGKALLEVLEDRLALLERAPVSSPDEFGYRLGEIRAHREMIDTLHRPYEPLDDEAAKE